MITSYTFGKMVIDGRTYTSDLIIFSDGHIRENWHRQSSHILTLADLDRLTAVRPGLIIAGTGAQGRMVQAPDLAAALVEMNIEIQAMDTAKAVTLYNRLLTKGEAPGACFHLTC